MITQMLYIKIYCSWCVADNILEVSTEIRKYREASKQNRRG